MPFRVNAELEVAEVDVACEGAWERQSNCVGIRSGAREEQFYCADNTLFSMYGDWTCGAYAIDSACLTNLQLVSFCVQQGDPNVVELNVAEEGMDFTMTTNAPGSCDSAQTVAYLGHAAAQGSRTASRRSAPRDRDTFVFEGSAGQKVVVALAKEGTAGHIGDAAVLRVLADDDAPLDETSGPLPLELDVELLATGTVQLVIEETGNAASSETGAPAEAFRGHYLLSVTPDLGAEGLLLEPQPDVEP